MFLEIIPYQNINLNDVAGFAMYPNSQYSKKSLYVYIRGLKESLCFNFDSEQDCRFAYNRLKKMLEKNGNSMEDYKDATYIY